MVEPAVYPRRSGSRDRVERVSGVLVQHGHLSDRAYLLEPSVSAAQDIAVLERLGREHGYSKLFAKTSAERVAAYEEAGFVVEARIPSDRSGGIVFCSRFLSEHRAVERFPAEVADTLAFATGQSRRRPSALMHASISSEQDADELAALYAEVFSSYPFDITDADFIRNSIAEGKTLFVHLRAEDGRIAAAASAEWCERSDSCELTDFATRPEYRGAGLAGALLAVLESEAANRGITTGYTIARSTSKGMNAVFARGGYEYAGTLVNNTHIAGRIESMNVWYRRLEHPSSRR